MRKVTAVAAVAVALTSCNRAEYAMLPKTSSAYHGTQRATIVKPAPAVAANTDQTASVAPEAIVAEAQAPIAAPQTAPATERAVVASAPVKEAAAKNTEAPKMSFAQKALVQKVAQKANKLAAKAQVNKKSEVASKEDTNAISRNIKLGIILLLVGLLLGLVSGILGSIVAIIGIVFIVLGLLDEV